MSHSYELDVEIRQATRSSIRRDFAKVMPFFDLNDNRLAESIYLMIAKKHLQHDIHVETSENDAEWRKGVSLCQNILGHDYDLMDITENGKLRFKTWELERHGR